ncbi:MAG TPA: peroxiredoxin [Burkholderiales bacterium]|nr:peroxiredoxin [Burkholderiales bacterium]
MRRDNLYELPPDLPVPRDDGACRHLAGMRLPRLVLASTAGRAVDLSALEGRTVVYCYPRTGRPDQDVPPGWNAIPGARGCTPQACAFRDRFEELRRAGAAQLFGLSTQDTAYQREAAQRLRLPFALLSDANLEFATALGLPTFEVAGMTLIKRLTLIVRAGAVEHVFYPVFPPDRNADEVLAWLTAAQRRAREQGQRR